MVYRGSLTGPVFGLRREVDRLFEDTIGGGARRGAWAPAVDVREDNTEIVFELELPGVRPNDVEVTAENGVVTIRGEKPGGSSERQDGRYHVTERSYGGFTRSFQLPSGVDERRIEAEFEHGVLSVRVPKAAGGQARRIEIKHFAGKDQDSADSAKRSANSGAER